MRLKKLEIYGFKSFADKVKFEFPYGITAIVGPNGSGKSNVSDAVMWVLGEQSVKSLRGGKMEDVIFAGTNDRKQMGFAEVSITIDNSDKKMSIEFSEVTITRRLYRSGESQFYINRAQCRLKDIHNLLMDTGLGRDGYSIIGQGKISEIINTKPESRRSIFEEAAGIVKYKTRKEETERKIEDTENNLVRVNDIITQLNEQLEPLKVQSEEAEKYLEIKEELKKIEIGMYIQEIDIVQNKIDETEQEKKKLEIIIKKNTEQINHINKSKNELSAKNEQFAKKLEEEQSKRFSNETKIQQMINEKRLNEERINNLRLNITRNSDYIDESTKKLQELEEKNSISNSEIKELKIQLETKLEELKHKEEELHSKNDSIKQNEEEAEKQKVKLINMLNDISNKKASINTIKALKENINTAINKLESQKQTLKNSIADIKSKLNDLNSQKEECGRNGKKCIEDINEKITEKNSNIYELNNLKEKDDKLHINIKESASRVIMLQEMEREFEGYAKSVKSILKACEVNKDLGQGVNGALAQLIKVDKDYETAIETALGGALQNIVTDTEQDAKKLIMYLKKNNIGRATFLPISTIRTKTIDRDIKEKVEGRNGYIGVASELVKYDNKYSGIVGSILGRVIIVDNIDNAVTLANLTRHTIKIVTLDGDVINPGGSMSGGSNNTKHNAFFSRSREIDELNMNLEKYKNDKKKVEFRIAEIKNCIERTEINMQQLNEQLQQYKIDFANFNNIIKQKEEELNNVESRLDTLKIEEDGILEQVKASDDNLEIENTVLTSMIKNHDEIDKNIKKINGIIIKTRNEYETINSEVNESKIDVSKIKQKLISLDEIKTNNNVSIAGTKKEIAIRNNENNKYNQDIVEIDNQIKSIEIQVNQLNEDRESIEKLIVDIHEDIEKLKNEIESITNKLTDVYSELEKAKQEIHKVDNNYVKYTSEQQAIHNSLWEKYEITYANSDEYRLEESKNLKSQVNELRKNLSKYPNVNTGAIEEYKRIKEKYDFLSSQKNDLEDSIKYLNEVIEDVTNSMRDQFREKFDEINENFQRVFTELFGGGKAKLVLTDETDVLESGIDIISQPPGKKLQNINLLSGGEKALTAISLLFALFEVKPSPFCILDEIEAALDDANVYRFANYLNNLLHSTQFIVITHRKGTMESAHNLYGVSMEEKGVSRVVSLKLDDKDKGKEEQEDVEKSI